jgi:hypothetical protein
VSDTTKKENNRDIIFSREKKSIQQTNNNNKCVLSHVCLTKNQFLEETKRRKYKYNIYKYVPCEHAIIIGP